MLLAEEMQFARVALLILKDFHGWEPLDPRTGVHGMLFLPGPVSGTVAAENAYVSGGFGNHDADRQCGTARRCDRILITMSADLSPGGGSVVR